MSEAAYKTVNYILQCRGIQARYVVDQPPAGTYLNLMNLEVRSENAVSSRLGRKAVTTNGTNTNYPIGNYNGSVWALGRLKALNDPTTGNPVSYRYAVGAGEIWRSNSTGTGQFAAITGSSAVVGPDTGVQTYRFSGNATPYIMFADNGGMYKDNGTLAQAQTLGCFPPTIPLVATPTAPQNVFIDFFNTDHFTYQNVSSPATHTIMIWVNTQLTTVVRNTNPGSGTGVAQWVTPQSMTNIAAGQILHVHDTVNPDEDVVVLDTNTTQFLAFFNYPKNPGATITSDYLSVVENVAASFFTITSPTFLADFSQYQKYTGAASNQFVLWMNVANPQYVTKLRLIFSFQNGNSAEYDIDPSGFTSGQWTQVNIPLSDITVASYNPDWAHTTKWMIECDYTTSPVTLQLGSMYLTAGTGGDSTGGSYYDYRYTFYNLNTGSESNPSQVMVSPVELLNQPASINMHVPTDTQFTHIRLYRRGGSLTNGWYMVDQILIPPSTTIVAYTDVKQDTDITGSDMLQLDNDPPLTTVLRTPVSTTITANMTGGMNPITVGSSAGIYPYTQLTVGNGANQEVVTVVSVPSPTTVLAYFQNWHFTGEAVTATERMGHNVNIFTVAFDQGWYAGDSDNPHCLYYSKKTNPEAVPPQNFIEVGTPSDPITGIFEFRSQLYVFTTTTVYNILGANIAGANLYPVKTGVSHGMIAPYLFCVADDAVYYISSDGVWAFRGGNSTYASEPIEGLFSGQNQGPIVGLQNNSPNAVQCVEFFENEVYISYIGTDNNNYRIVWSTVYKRWRNDDVGPCAMLNEKDNSTLLIARTELINHGTMIYLDRSGNYDSIGFFSGTGETKVGINIDLQSAYQDQGAPAFQKVHQNLMLDIDTQGETLTPSLGLNSGALSYTGFNNVVQNGRAKVQLPVNNGAGVSAYTSNFRLTGSVMSQVTIYQAEMEVTVEAKIRRAFDTYWLKDGSDEYKLAKQGWFEYVAPDANGLNVAFYTEGSSTPLFTKTLPQSAVRTAKKLRFPATKYKIRRIIITSSSDFQLYDTSHVEIKPLCGGKGYAKQTLAVNQ